MKMATIASSIRPHDAEQPEPGPVDVDCGPYWGCKGKSGKIDFARQLRRHATPAERALWEVLRRRRLLGYKFRRQAPVLGYFADFYCPRLKLILEVDGGIHSGDDPAAHVQAAWDARRDAQLAAKGYRTIRLSDDAVLDDLEAVLVLLRTIVADRAAAMARSGGRHS